MLARPLATSRRSMKQHCPSSLPERCVVASAAWPTCLQQHQAVPPQRNGACSAASTRARPVRDTITSSLRRPAHAPSRPGPPLCASSSPTAVPHAHQQQEQGASIGGKQQLTWMTCKRCKQRFAAEQNHRTACRYHSENWTGGELAKAVGFVRQSEAPEHQLGAVMGRTGLLRFWDCCGAEDEGAPGCCTHYHVSFDEEVNERYGWAESN